jgi:hypothetical protein
MNPRLSLLTFPQRYDGARLHVRILVVPRLDAGWSGDPLQPLILNFPVPGDATDAFADADLRFEARVLAGLDRFPTSVAPDVVEPLPAASGVVATSRPLFESLVAPLPGRFKLTPGAPRLAGEPEDRFAISKYLPRSYRESFVFTGPRTKGAVTDDSYHCAIKAKAKPNPAFVSTPDTVSWGQVYAYCLRQPRLAMRLGLVREASFAVDDALFEKGGWVYVDLTAGSAYGAQAQADFTFLARYAARIPRLTGGDARQLFAAVQFPVRFDDPMVPGPPAALGTYDQVFIEAADYDDGFAKIVHGAQPVSQNLLAEEPDGIAPVNDIGIRLGWDDEQILAWQNRQLVPDPTVPKVGGKAQRLDAPMGVFGYRIDARASQADPWRSLVRVRPRAPVLLDGVQVDAPEDTDPGMEFPVEVHPMQLDGNQATGRFWLPAYLAQWSGASLVLPDEDAAALYHTEGAGGALGRQYTPLGLDDIPLRYGNSYQLRVRLMDPTGGGPEEGDTPIHEAPAPVATVPFRRHVVPEPVRIADLTTFPPPAPAADPEAPDAPLFAGNALHIGRPRLGYPSVVFTGKYVDPITRLQAASDRSLDPDPASRDRVAFGIPDPDVQRLRFDVEVRALRMDNKLSLSRREGWALLYSTTRAFDADVDAERVVPLAFRQANVLRFGDPTDLGDLGLTAAQIDLMDELPLPRSRDIRITVRAEATADAAYWAAGANVGKPMQVMVRRESTDEAGLIADDSDARRIRALWLRPDPVPAILPALGPLLFQRVSGEETPSIVERLAQQVDVAHKGMTLVGNPGERVAFACSRRIRHTLAPDASSLTLAAKEDLTNHWIVALTLRLDRDWTWEGLRHIGFHVFREGNADPGGRRQVGEWEIIQTASMQALQDPERTYTRLVFLDAVEPQWAPPLPGQPPDVQFPDLVELRYTVEPRLKAAPVPPDVPLVLSLRLPVTTPPAQVPRIVAAGLALSEYRRNEAYSATEPRRRYLWLEFEQPPADPNDTYFIRLLGYAPDILLSDHRPETLVPPEESPLAIDPEHVRVITPGQGDDSAGLNAMIPLTPGSSPRHFLVPLPPGLTAESPEMFGFFTYELRVGHMGIWSTAQGRFGRALRSTGVQHPAPTLFCTATRDENVLVVEAPYAQAVFNGKNITANPPRTQIWALLYAQVRQADDKDWRNVLLDDRMLRVRPRGRGGEVFGSKYLAPVSGFVNRDAAPVGVIAWESAEVTQMLRALGLPVNSALSVLCAEMMPTMAALAPRPAGTGAAGGDVAAMAYAERSGLGVAVGNAANDVQVRPLSEGLGHFRILRTSPLTEVPEVCCADC